MFIARFCDKDYWRGEEYSLFANQKGSYNDTNILILCISKYTPRLLTDSEGYNSGEGVEVGYILLMVNLHVVGEVDQQTVLGLQHQLLYVLAFQDVLGKM